jgi:Icc protein
MTIAHLTDLHIGLPGEDTSGVDVRKNFLRALTELRERQPDLLVISGDLCYRDAVAEIYHWVREALDRSGLSYRLLSGNHDDSRLLATSFGQNDLLKEGELYYAEQWHGQDILFLDSSTGRISPPQMQWLQEELAHRPGNILLFMHHPPVDMGVPYMDHNYALQNQDELLHVLQAHPYPISVFCGHYHVDKSLRLANLDIHITPSCFFQIDWREEAFAVDHYRFGYRWLQYAHGGWQHGVRYLNED